MSSYAGLIAESARLAILQILAEVAEYRHNHYIVHIALSALGFSLSGDALRAPIVWLQEQGLFSVVRPVFDLCLLRLTARGADAAAGRARVPGVARPQPERV